jgi:IS30 family transposase
VRAVLISTGGIAPTPRRRSRLSLSFAEREEISRGLASGKSLRQIAAAVQRSPSTVSREVARNLGPSRYRAGEADDRAFEQARRPKRCRLASQGRLRQVVASKLRRKWSPQQIAGWLRVTFPNHPEMHVSHETIYRTLFIQARGALKKELTRYLRSPRALRRARTYNPKRQGRGGIVDAISIRERPAAVEDRAVPGHWEGDLLAGGNDSWIATLVERRSRFVMLVKVKGRDSESVTKALARQMRWLPSRLRRSLTWDRGGEMARHKDFTIATDIKVYFCDPRSPWQRGSNENTNGLLRQYFPKGKDISGFSQTELNRVARELNERPRKTLDFKTPADTFNAMLR